MAKTVKSCKAKGRRLQNFVRDMLRDIFSDLHPDDIKSQTMGMTGEDIVLSPAARKRITFSFECKNVEKLQIWKAINQANSNNRDCSSPAVVFKRNGTEVYIAIPFTVFCDMVKAEDDRNFPKNTT